MTICNTNRVKDEITETIDSDITPRNCKQNISNADMLDFKTDMDNLSFYEKTSWNACEDLIYVQNEECLWQTIVGEIKTPLGVLNNSIGQQGYGCSIWELRGQVLDSLTVKEIEHEIINTCLKYPEVTNVIDIESYVANEDGALYVELTLDTIYGTFDGSLRIPNALRSNKKWQKTDDKFFN